MTPVPPSGRQVELRAGEARATIVEVGGGIRTYDVGARRVVDGYARDEMAGGGRGQPLMPWPNRLRGGRYPWDGADLQVAVNEVDKGNASHGLVRWANWSAHDVSDPGVTMLLRLHASSGYPFVLDLAMRYELSSSGLTVTTTATNVGANPAPFGAGFHPYVTAGAGLVDECELVVPAATSLVSDEQLIPTGAESVDGSPYDFREPRRIGATVIDTCFTDLARADGRTTVTLTGPDGEVDVWMDESFTHVMVFTGDTLPPDRRRRSVAIEPMTCAPNAFATGEGVLRLEPGDTFTGTWGISPR
jgi:aldose 1-epimerase